MVTMNMGKILKKSCVPPFFTIFLKILVLIVTEIRVGAPRLDIEIKTGVHNLSKKLSQGD